MPTGVAVVCDTDDSFAVYLAVATGDERRALRLRGVATGG